MCRAGCLPGLQERVSPAPAAAGAPGAGLVLLGRGLCLLCVLGGLALDSDPPTLIQDGFLLEPYLQYIAKTLFPKSDIQSFRADPNLGPTHSTSYPWVSSLPCPGSPHLLEPSVEMLTGGRGRVYRFSLTRSAEALETVLETLRDLSPSGMENCPPRPAPRQWDIPSQSFHLDFLICLCFIYTSPRPRNAAR